MKTTVARILLECSSGGYAIAQAQFACGHIGAVEMVKAVYACCGCDARRTGNLGQCACGHKGGYKAVLWPNPHKEEHRITKAGAGVDCEQCDRYQARLTQLRALKSGDVQHSRFRHNDSRGFGPGCYYVYRRDPKSPTGVTLLMSIEGTDEAAQVLSALSAAPLSPTEPR